MNMAICKQCGDLLVSKHRHDFVQCNCPNQTFVDGGNDYVRCGAKDFSLVIIDDTLTEEEARKLSNDIKTGLA